MPDGFETFYEIGIALCLVALLVLLVKQYRDRD
ncbi:hypothetical protein BH20ACT5_BH20ACT5_20210 [soil metagenome]